MGHHCGIVFLVLVGRVGVRRRWRGMDGVAVLAWTVLLMIDAGSSPCLLRAPFAPLYHEKCFQVSNAVAILGPKQYVLVMHCKKTNQNY